MARLGRRALLAVEARRHSRRPRKQVKRSRRPIACRQVDPGRPPAHGGLPRALRRGRRPRGGRGRTVLHPPGGGRRMKFERRDWRNQVVAYRAQPPPRADRPALSRSTVVLATDWHPGNVALMIADGCAREPRPGRDAQDSAGRVDRDGRVSTGDALVAPAPARASSFFTLTPPPRRKTARSKRSTPRTVERDRPIDR